MKRKILIALFSILLMFVISLTNLGSVSVLGSDVHDVAVVNVTVSPIRLSIDRITSNVTVRNEGTVNETFGVTLWAGLAVIINGTPYGEYGITHARVTDLAPGANRTLKLEGYIWDFRLDMFPGPWGPTQLLVKNLTMVVWAWPVAGEVDTSDNFYVDGTIRCVWMFVDVDGNGKVEIKDLTLIARAYGSSIGDPWYNPNYDINQDGKIDIKELASTARVYGFSYA